MQCLTSQYGMGVLELTSIRMVATGLLLLAFLQLRGHPVRRDLLREPKTLAKAACFGIVGVFASQLVYVMAIAGTNAGTATMLCCLDCVMLLVVVCLATHRAPRPAELAGIMLALVSVWLIATGGDPAGLAISPTGLAWGIGCAAAITFYTIFSKPLMTKMGSLPALAVGMLFGGAGSSAGAVWHWSFPALDAFGWLLLVCVVVLGTVVTFALFFQAVMDLQPVEVGVLSVVEPVVATVLSAVWLGTAFNPIDYVAFGLMIGMVVLTSVSGSQEPAAGTAPAAAHLQPGRMQRLLALPGARYCKWRRRPVG